jgi:phosphate transport system protein
MNRAIDKLTKRFLSVGTLAEEALHNAVISLENRDGALAAKVIADDDRIDNLEVDVEEECLKILALYQPVATDLRYVIAILKMNNDLERVGDLAVNIAERAAFLATQPPVKLIFDFHGMAEKAKEMLGRSMDALINLDSNLAQKVCAADDEVDDMNRQVYVRVQEAINQNPGATESLLHMLSIARHLERIADLAGNIAQDVIYMVEGKIVRHKTEHYVSILQFPEKRA